MKFIKKSSGLLRSVRSWGVLGLLLAFVVVVGVGVINVGASLASCQWLGPGIALYPDPITCKVGIGVANPLYQLDIGGANAPRNLLAFTVNDPSQPLLPYIAAFRYEAGLPTAPFVLNLSNNLSGTATGYNRPFAIMNGNVGIGTMTPVSKLAVVGLKTTPPVAGAQGLLCIDPAGNVWKDTTLSTPCVP